MADISASSSAAAFQVSTSTSAANQAATGAGGLKPKEAGRAAEGGTPQKAQVAEAAKQINQALKQVRQELSFSRDDVTGETVIKVIDSDSDEVVRQIPSKEVLALARQLTELTQQREVSKADIKGLLLRARA